MYTWNAILITFNTNHFIPSRTPIWLMSFWKLMFLILTLTKSPSWILGYFLYFLAESCKCQFTHKWLSFLTASLGFISIVLCSVWLYLLEHWFHVFLWLEFSHRCWHEQRKSHEKGACSLAQWMGTAPRPQLSFGENGHGA